MLESPGDFAVVELVHFCCNDGRDVKNGGIKANIGEGIGKDGTGQVKFILRCNGFIKFGWQVAFFHNTDGFLGIIINDPIAGVIKEESGDNTHKDVEPVQSKRQD